MARDYYASGALDEITLRENRAAYDRIALRYHVLADVGVRDTSTPILGRVHPWPVVIAPTAFMRLADPDGEVAVARAAHAEGVTQTISALSTASLEEIAAAVPEGSRWFQLYVFRDRELTRDLVRRAEAAGCTAIELTADTPVLGRRERDARNAFALPPGLSMPNLARLGEGIRAPGTAPGSDSILLQFFAAQVDPALSWRDLDWLCSITSLPVLVKGVVRGDDAARAIEAGAAGVVVSNHGGRQLDTAIATIDALPEVAAAVDGRGAVLVDGGVRRGTDILKAIALGAQAVQIGRPVLWALAVGGEAGVRRMLAILREDFDRAMALAGTPDLASITPDLIVQR
ncbi:MAG: alpha-hydroxy-acid oxidizing protein [Dehalococcoidia bacterium]|nr:alpha-hydroxy-acid oxidizing protein [Dehalococcoidia bacterium]